MRVITRVVVALLFSSACVHDATSNSHGVLPKTLAAADPAKGLCDHGVPAQDCTQCHPEQATRFKAEKDWCGPHGVPESHCFKCHPDLNFEAMPALADGADLKKLVHAGEDIGSLESHAVPGKVTVFDFYANWCAACRNVDRHMIGLLNTRTDVAHRRLNVVSWETPIAARYLANVPGLPLIIVYGKSGKRVATIHGADLTALDKAIAAGEQQ